MRSFLEDSECLLCPTLVTRRKTSVSITLPSSKLTLSRHIYKTLLILVRMHSMQDARHMNFVIDFVHRRVCFSVVEHRSAESKGLRFVSSWRLRIFSISHARDKTANIFLYFFTQIKTYTLSYSIYMQFFISCLGLATFFPV